MTNSIGVIGSGGHCRSLIALLKLLGFRNILIYDDAYNYNLVESILGIPIVGNTNDIKTDCKIIIALGDTIKRKELFETYKSCMFYDSLVHPSVLIESTANIGQSNQLFAGVIINSMVEVGLNNIINTGAIIEHEVSIGNHNHISIGSIIAGRVNIGNYCFIGAGATIIDNITICDNVVIGANSVVIKDIRESGVYAGNPIKKIK